MRKHFNILACLLLVAALTLGMSFTGHTSATVPGTNYLVSQDSSGNWANGSSNITGLHSVSGDGRYVVFTSSASNLVASDTNNKTDVFVKDTQTGAVTLVDVSDTGVQASGGAGQPAISYSGRYVTFTSLVTWSRG